jgi:hypothetical protein
VTFLSRTGLDGTDERGDWPPNIETVVGASSTEAVFSGLVKDVLSNTISEH